MTAVWFLGLGWLILLAEAGLACAGRAVFSLVGV